MKSIALLMIITLCLFSKEIVVWNTVEFPPSLITKGEKKDQGFSDKTRILISKKLTEYRHELINVNSARAISNLKEKENHCFSGLNKNEKREEFVHFSDSFMLSLPNELVIKKDKYKKFTDYIDKDGLIDLEKLILNKNLTLSYTKERSYNPIIDKLIVKYQNNDNLVYRPASDLTSGFLNMLRENRADYIIEYPTMVAYYSNDEFLTLPIKNANKTFPVYIGCSKTKTGKEIIQRINTIIRENNPLFSKYYADYLDEETKNRYLNSVQE